MPNPLIYRYKYDMNTFIPNIMKNLKNNKVYSIQIKSSKNEISSIPGEHFLDRLHDTIRIATSSAISLFHLTELFSLPKIRHRRKFVII